MTRRLEEHAARMRIRSADRRMVELQIDLRKKRAGTPERRAAFLKFWDRVENDLKSLRVATLRERTRKLRAASRGVGV